MQNKLNPKQSLRIFFIYHHLPRLYRPSILSRLSRASRTSRASRKSSPLSPTPKKNETDSGTKARTSAETEAGAELLTAATVAGIADRVACGAAY